jgi:hypothetical protein
MALLQTYFSEWWKFFLKYFTSSAIAKQAIMKRIAVLPIFEKEKGIVLFSTLKLKHIYTNVASISLNPSATGRFSHKIL